MMNGNISEILDKVHYIKLKYEGGEGCYLFPLLYYNEKSIVLYNRNLTEISDDKQVFMNITEDEFEYVIKGIVKNKENNVIVDILEVKKYINKRKSRRYEIIIDSQIEYNAVKYDARIINISESGVLICIDKDLSIGEQISVNVDSEMMDGTILRKEKKDNKSTYGIKFKHACNIIEIIKKIKSIVFEERNVHVLIDNFDDLKHYKDLFDKEVNISFINVKSNFESFIIDFLEREKKDTIIVELKEENQIIYMIDKLKKYLDIEKHVIVLIDENCSDELLEFIQNNKTTFIFKSFIEIEMKEIMLKMS